MGFVKIRAIFAVLAVATLATPLAHGADAPAKVTLEQAMEAAAKSSPDLAVVAERVTQSEADVRSAYAGFLPQVTAQGSYLWYNKELPLVFNGIDTGIFLQKNPTYSGQVVGTLPLLNPQAFPVLAAAKHGERATEYAAFAGRQELMLGVAQAYWANVVTGQLVKAADEAVANAHELSRVAGEQVKAQVTTNLALFRAKAAEEQAQQFAISARGSQAQAQAALRRLTGIEGPIEVVAPQVADPAPANEAELWRYAQAHRADLLAANEAVKARIALYHGRFNAYVPLIAAQGEWHYTSNPGFIGEHDGGSLGVVAQWNLLNGGLREQQIGRASSQAREAAAQYHVAERRAREEVSKAVTDLQTAIATRDAAREGAEFARQAQTLAQTQYRAGTATNLEVTQANATLLQAQAGFAQAEAQAAIAQLALKLASGDSLH